MSRLLPIVRDTRLYPLWVLAATAAILFLGLGNYGFWEPHEIDVALRAGEIANPKVDDSEDAANAPTRSTRRQTRSELDAELAASAIRASGRSEGSSRGPVALLALITVMCTFFIGQRIGGPRAGLYAAAIIVGFPAILMHGRHLNSEIGSAAGSAMIFLGLIGLLGSRPKRRVFIAVGLYVLDAALIAGGVLLSYRAAGALLGVLPPLAALAFGGAIAIVASRGADRWRAAIATAIATVAAIAAFGAFFSATFDLIDPDEVNAANQDKVAMGAVIETVSGHWYLGGKDTRAETDYVPELAGIWRRTGDKRVGFSSTLETLAVGTFPWVAIFPLAVLALLIGRGRTDYAARATLALWALAAYVIGDIFARKVGTAMYPAWGALAAASGVWLADAFDPERVEGEATGRGALPLAAFFVVCAAVVVGKDILAFPEKLTSLNLSSAQIDFPKGISVHYIWLAFGWAAALCMAIALATRDLAQRTLGEGRIGRTVAWTQRISQRGALLAAFLVGVLGALFFTQALTPALSIRLSSKNVLGVYEELRADGDVLGIMGRANGASYYAGTDYEELRGRSQLLEFLERPSRVFALAPLSELCPLNKEARRRDPKSEKLPLDYFVVDDSSAQYLLFSNQLKPGERDANPLRSIFSGAPPKDIRVPLSWNLDNQLELVGVSMPDSVRKGSTFKMKLYFKVNAAVTRNWKVFVHFDTGVRFQGDHDPIDGTCGTVYWLPGDFVVDEFEVTAGSRTHPAGVYRVWAGLFVGSAGNYTNMTVVTEGADQDHRIPIGTITLK